MSEPGSKMLDAISACNDYLTLPRAYTDHLGGVRYSDRSNELVTPAGKTIVLHDELAEFIEGFASSRPLPVFGVILHWAMLLQDGPGDKRGSRLHGAFQYGGMNWRNAGALAAAISHSYPDASDAPPADVLCLRLRNRTFPTQWFSGALNGLLKSGEEPPVPLDDFEAQVDDAVASLSDEELIAWMKFGRGPLPDAGKLLAQEHPNPRTMGQVVAELLKRPRLAGAEPYVTQMVTALSLPARRSLPEQLPLGGYSEIVTHGNIDRLLPSQHALDDLEFMRRFSEQELLYFRREEPPSRHRHELVIVVDQGVRTWGDVRLVLTAAALALAQQSERKEVAVFLACTSRPRPLLVPLETPAAQVGAVLEASDFSRNPGLALESVLETPAAVPRDILLLTHPYNIDEDDVQAAARRLARTDRLFALTVNGKGHAELAEIRHGLPVRLRAFHVDFFSAPIPQPQEEPDNSPTGPGWSGDIEPVPWPFRFGTDGAFRLFGFDYIGRRLLAVLENSLIHCWDLKSGDVEILPRPMKDGRRAGDWYDIVGVAGGFALLGVLEGQCVLCHYDCQEQTCRLHGTTMVVDLAAICVYLRSCHTVVVVRPVTLEPYVAIDLSTGENSLSATLESRVHRALQQVRQGLVNPSPEDLAPKLATRAGRTQTAPVLDVSATQTAARSDPGLLGYKFFPEQGSLAVAYGKTVTPILAQADGKNLWKHARIFNVQLAEKTIAVKFCTQFAQHTNVLSLYRRCKGEFVRQVQFAYPPGSKKSFQLSRDGERIAWLSDGQHLEVETVVPGPRLLRTRVMRPGKTRLWVGKDHLLLSCARKGHFWHLLSWVQGGLKVCSELCVMKGELSSRNFKRQEIGDFLAYGNPAEADYSPPIETMPFPVPFPAGSLEPIGIIMRHGCFWVLDRIGRVLIFDHNIRVVFQFFAHGDSWSAWLPDGTRHGVGMIHSWPNTPGALKRMGQVLRTATGGSP
jgi:hypothetical protein